MNAGEIVRGLADAAIAAADPACAVRRAWEGARIDAAGRVTLLAIGKGALGMAGCAIELLGDRLAGGVVLAPAALVERGGAKVDGLERVGLGVLGCDHPVPTERNVAAAACVERVAREAGEDDLVLVLLSGGGSAFVSSPAEGLGLDDVREVTACLLRSGATIGELNCVRKHCERLKGGRLAAMAWPARVVALVVSDVVGDRLDVIASGPTVADGSTFDEALAVLDRRGCGSARLRGHLEQGVAGDIEETPKAGDARLARAVTRVIASNGLACDAAVRFAGECGLAVCDRRDGVEGEAADVGRGLAQRAVDLRSAGRRGCVVWGGETTVLVGDAAGVGGRNQEVALAAAEVLAGVDGVAVVSVGTDGVDGPTDAAGAVVDGGSWAAMLRAGNDPVRALAEHDSHRALDAVGGLIRTGPTGTNVCDVMAAVVV